MANRVGARTARRVLGGPGLRAAPRRGGRHAGARLDHRAGPQRRCAPRPAPTSGSPTTPWYCSSSAVPRARRRSTGRCRRPPGAGRRRCRGAARTRPQEHPRPAHPGAGDPPYVAVPYLNRMDLAYAAADLAICRSGAMTVAEVSAVGLPAVYVPLPIGNGEQRLNALPVVDAGGGLLVDDADLTPEFIAREVVGLLGDPVRLAAMTAAADRVGHRDAAQRVAEVAVEVARAGRKVRRVNRPLPAELQRVQWVGIGGPGCPASPASCWTAVGRVSGSDAKESRGWPRCGPRRADQHRPRRRQPRPAAGRADRGGHHPRRDTQDQPRTRRGPQARRAGDPAPGGAGEADGRAPHPDGDRHPRQDHHHLDADRRPAAQRAGPLLRRRR